jgi:hypothetical protein
VRRREKKEPIKPPTLADKWADMARRECAKGLVDWMKKSMDLSRRMNTLTKPEAENMAHAVISTWIVLASKRPAWDDSEEAQSTAALLGG